jgi:hypothetical protein
MYLYLVSSTDACSLTPLAAVLHLQDRIMQYKCGSCAGALKRVSQCCWRQHTLTMVDSSHSRPG